VTRTAVLTELADAIVRLRLPHPTRVAVDGVDAAGKTTLADELAVEEAARRRYERRYVPGQRLYLKETRPAETADAVVENGNPASPRLTHVDRGHGADRHVQGTVPPQGLSLPRDSP
jgi:hypothetical protein